MGSSQHERYHCHESGAINQLKILSADRRNRAIHFSTDRALTFGNLTVPADDYTLFSIPAADGGMLIINRQTGQNGQQYDEKQDLVRVPLRARSLQQRVEVFTILAREEGGQGVLALQLDRTEMVAEFSIT